MHKRLLNQTLLYTKCVFWILRERSNTLAPTPLNACSLCRSTALSPHSSPVNLLSAWAVPFINTPPKPHLLLSAGLRRGDTHAENSHVAPHHQHHQPHARRATAVQARDAPPTLVFRRKHRAKSETFVTVAVAWCMLLSTYAWCMLPHAPARLRPPTSAEGLRPPRRSKTHELNMCTQTRPVCSVAANRPQEAPLYPSRGSNTQTRQQP